MSVAVLLAVDDRPDNLFVLEQLVATYLPDIKLLPAPSAEAGLHLVGSEAIDGALIDVQMPGMNGIEMCRRLKGNPDTAHIHVILVTAHRATPELKAQGLEAGADDFITKPLDNIELVAKLKVMLRLQAAEKALRRERDLLEETVQERTQALRDAEHRYRTLFQAAADPIFINTLEGQLLEVNEEACRLLGYTRDELLRLTVYDLIPAQFAAQRPDILAQLRAAGCLRFENELVGKDGRIIPIECNSRIMDLQGQPTVFSITRDISERQAAEEALRKSEAKYRLVFDQAPLGIMHYDQTSTVTDSNEKFAEIIGAPKEQFIGFNIMRQLRDAKLREAVAASLQGQVGYYEGDYLSVVGGKLTALRAIFQPLVSASGATSGGISIFEDITARQRAEQALKQSEWEKNLILESVDELVAFEDQDLRIIFANRAAGASVGETPENLVGRFCYEVWHHRNQPCVPCVVQEALKTRQLQSCETTTPDGRWWCIQAYPAWDDHGQLAGIVEVGRDITAHKQAEEALKKSEEQYRLLVDNAAEAVLVAQDVYLKFFNYATVTILGQPAEKLAANPFVTFIHPDDREMVMSNHQRRIRGETLPPVYSFRVVDQTGQVRWVEIRSVRIDWEGKPATLNFLTDDTARRQAEEALRESLARVTAVQYGAIQALATVSEMRDPYTAGHQRRVAQLACAVARKMGLSADLVASLRVIGLLHDIGKIGIPAEILSKPGKLNEVEFDLIKSHAQAGYDILKDIEFPWPVAEVVLQHHERLNGSGYPRGLTAPDILLEAKILAVADVVEAMASHRPYRASLGLDLALEELARQKGVLYDPDAVEACIKVFTEEGFQFD